LKGKFFVAAILLLITNTIACSKAETPPTVKPTPTPNIKGQVVTFLKTIDKLDKQAEEWGKELNTFITYSPGLTFQARQAKYQELLTKFNALKTATMAVERPPVDKARALHDAYSTQMSKLAQLFTLAEISLGQGMPADNVTQARVQALMDELTLTGKQVNETRADLVKQFDIIAADLSQ